MWNRYLHDASESCANKAYFWIAVFWLQNTGRGWKWGIPNGVSNFHWEEKQRKYLKKPVCPMLASITINYYFRVIMFSKYSSKKPQSDWDRFCGSHLQEWGNAFQRTIGKQWKNISFCLAVFLENAGFVGEDIAGMTLAVGLNMFKDLTHCILWKNVCVFMSVLMWSMSLVYKPSGNVRGQKGSRGLTQQENLNLSENSPFSFSKTVRYLAWEF